MTTTLSKTFGWANFQEKTKSNIISATIALGGLVGIAFGIGSAFNGHGIVPDFAVDNGINLAFVSTIMASVGFRSLANFNEDKMSARLLENNGLEQGALIGVTACAGAALTCILSLS
ncbi:MAG: hypothetical protein CMH32_02810 [Micavibrio sp.]|nr:hypothetical protein [Micavibrio sp.]HCK33206.1 hypothetical protein [Rhodospirillaceae bacterium]|tara:strand:+ start:110 stop:460 length:351 start_codon:yes stop_codon:yes gene_type:complete